MKSALDKQTTHLANIDKTLHHDRLIQLSQLEFLQNKTDSDINGDQEKANAHLNEIQKSSKETASNVFYLFKEFKKYSEEFEKQAKIKEDNTVDKALKLKLSPEKRSLWSGTEKEKKQFGTAKGFLRQSGLISEGGFIDNMLQRKDDKNQFIKDSMQRDPNLGNLKQYQGKDGQKKLKRDIGNKFEQTQDTVRKLQNNKEEFDRLEAQGWDPSDKKNAKLFAPLAEERSSLAASLEKNDKRFRSPTVEKATANNTVEKATTNELLNFSDEGQLEQQRSQEKSIDLLEKIEENTRGNKTTATAPVPKEASGGFGGLLDSIMSFIGPGFIKLFKTIFNPRNLLKAFTKIFVPAMIIGSIISGIVDAFKTFFNGGSFLDVIIAGLGGMLEFLTFGLFDAKSLRSLVDGISGFVDDYIIEPIKNFMGFLGESFDKYIAQPIMDAFNYIGELFTQYIVEPIKQFFAPITNFFKQIKDQVFGFLQDFGIPEIGFTIPGFNKKVSIGPFYPFRAQESSNKSQTQSSESSQSTISNESQKTTSSKSSTNTTNSTLTNVTEITKEEEAYKKLSFFDKLKVDTGFAKASELVKVEKPTISTGNAVYDQSSKNTEMAMKPAPTQAPVVVSSSTTNNTNKQSIAMPAPVRNQDSEFGRYVSRRALVI
jgi:hypothetical protein